MDDSALMRKLIPQTLVSDPSIEVVGTAMDGLIGLRKIEELHPHVVTLDLEMPRMDGMEMLRQITRKHHIPVIVFSAHTEQGADVTLKALSLGAFDFVTKPLGRGAGANRTDRLRACAENQGCSRFRRPQADHYGVGIRAKRFRETRIRSGAVGPRASWRSGFPPAGPTRCNICSLSCRRIFRDAYWSCSTCRKDLRKCLRGGWTNPQASK